MLRAQRVFQELVVRSLSLSVRRDQFGDQIKASLNRGLVASTRQLALDVLGCIILPGPAGVQPSHADVTPCASPLVL